MGKRVTTNKNDKINTIREMKTKLKAVLIYLADIIENYECFKETYFLHNFFNTIQKMLIIGRENMERLEEKEKYFKEIYQS